MPERSRGEEALERRLRALPQWRREKALAYRRPLDRFLCAEAYLLLERALKEQFGLPGPFEFEYGPCGKPFLKGHPGIHFNISHCSRCVCCAVSDRPVGVDVETIQYDPDVAAYAFSDEELSRIRGAVNSGIVEVKETPEAPGIVEVIGASGTPGIVEVKEISEARGIIEVKGILGAPGIVETKSAPEAPEIAFTRLWTMKESAWKLTGEGAPADPKAPLPAGIAFRTEIIKERGYVLTWAETRR